MTNDDAKDYRPRRAALSTPHDEAPDKPDPDTTPVEPPRPRRSWDPVPEPQVPADTPKAPADTPKVPADTPKVPADTPKATADTPKRQGTTGGAAAAIGAAANWVNRARRGRSAESSPTQPVRSGDTPAPANPRPVAGATPTPVVPRHDHTTVPAQGRPDRSSAGAATSPDPEPTADTPKIRSSAAIPDSGQRAEATPRGPGYRGPAAGSAAAASVAPKESSPTPKEPEGVVERPHNPFADLEDDESTNRRFGLKKREGENDGPGRRAAGRASAFRRSQTPVGRRAVQRRNTTALTIAGIATIAVIALVVSYVLWARGQQAETARSAEPTAVPGLTPGPVLTEAAMMTDGMAKAIDPSRTWTTTLTQNGATEQSPGAACIGPQATGQPIPQLTYIRGLTANGDDRTQTLHRADAFNTPEEAAQVYNFRANELGGCVGSPLYVEKGMDVKGLGNQALGVRVVLLEQSAEYHTIILARTGKIVDVVDVVRFGRPVEAEGITKALAQVINRQCSAAVGLCVAPKVEVATTVPPPGGDQPGFLAAGDIPRITVGQGVWKGNALANRVDVQDGSGCESIDFNTTAGATARQQRTYLLRNDPKAPPQFGIDEVVLTMNGANDAQGLADRITQSIESCETRTLVAKVPANPRRDITAPGLGGMPVKGKWYAVNVRVDANRSAKYRVAVLTAGQKVIYLRSNPSDTFDFTDDQWLGVALRAGERATQAR